MLFGALGVVVGIGGCVCSLLRNNGLVTGDISAASVGVSGMIYGYLFLLGRDALEAIEELIREVGEIV